EDGIRDVHVTGVQTCALPIWLDQLSARWQQEIDEKIQEVEAMYKSYTAERPMLSDEMRKKREDEIMAREKEVKELQKQRFGFEEIGRASCRERGEGRDEEVS